LPRPHRADTPDHGLPGCHGCDHRARLPTIKERAGPTNFLSEEQRRRFGHFAEDLDEGQLAGPFLLDQTARRRAMAAKGARNRLGWAVQLGTLRYLGTFLDNPEQVPTVVLDYVAEQLGLNPSDLAGYGAMEHRWDHQGQIRAAYGYTKFEFDTTAGRLTSDC
jgi:hypothetical protein